MVLQDLGVSARSRGAHERSSRSRPSKDGELGVEDAKEGGKVGASE
jgi:hypothetical protein